ncbi:MAG TPA: polysaccharide biosynthesis/export family protein [Rhizomicrobium sp.]|jgi:polysaccharide export outer membrane protein|nr:polysaccharide biosynthesis/export family protein [Rhizomicrobium sp.]
MTTTRALTRLFARVAVLVFACCAVASTSGARAAPAEPSLRGDQATQPESDPVYRLGTGDKVRVIVFGEDDLGGEFQIDDGGFIRLPLIGQLHATGLSPRELETHIAAALAAGYLNEPRVSVEVTDYRPFYIIGEVNKPGQYPYVNDMTAPNAIALGGGYTVKASDSWIYVRRDGEKTEERLPADATTRIHPGDVVRVPPTLFWAAVTFAGPLSAIISTRWYLPQPPQ